MFLDVRDAACKILDNTTLADLIQQPPAGSRQRSGKKKKAEPSVLPMVVHGGGKEGHD